MPRQEPNYLDIVTGWDRAGVSVRQVTAHQDGRQLKRQNTAMTIKLLNFTKLWGISSNGVKMSVWSRPAQSQFIIPGGRREVPLQVFVETAN